MQSNPVTNKYDILFDYSSLSQLVCARKYQLGTAFGYQVEDLSENEYIIFGNACHKFAEAYAKETDPYFASMPPDIARVIKIAKHSKLPAPPQLTNAYNTAIFAVSEHIDRCPPPLVDNNGVIGIEYKFQIPITETERYNFHLCGTIDRIQPLLSNTIAIVDWKTTTRPDRLSTFEFTFQLPLYMWVFSEYFSELFPPAKSLVGQIWLVKWNTLPASVEEGSLLKGEPNTPDLLSSAIEKLKYIYDLGDEVAPAEGLLYSKVCENCQFKKLCQARDTGIIREILRVAPKEPYNPLKHRD